MAGREIINFIKNRKTHRIDLRTTNSFSLGSGWSVEKYPNRQTDKNNIGLINIEISLLHFSHFDFSIDFKKVSVSDWLLSWFSMILLITTRFNSLLVLLNLPLNMSNFQGIMIHIYKSGIFTLSLLFYARKLKCYFCYCENIAMSVSRSFTVKSKKNTGTHVYQLFDGPIY